MRPRRATSANAVATMTLAALLLGAPISAMASNAALDAALVEKLQYGEEISAELNAQMGDRLSPAQIRALRDQLELEEAARQNPIPPRVSNKVVTLERGESPTIDIMQRFDTTLIFADRAGNPLTIRSARVSDPEAARLIPLHDNATVVYESGVEARREAEGQGDSFEDPRVQSEPANGSGKGAVNALIVSPSQSMRSTNLTVRVSGEDYPIILTIRSHPSNNTERTIAYMQEIRLDWLVNMSREEQLAGKYQVGRELGSEMISLLQGVPTPNLQRVELEGGLSGDMSLWRDATSRTNSYYLRLADYISPWNVAIEDQSHDRMRGFTVIKINGAPPRSIGVSANGRYHTVSIAE